jgi:site-specific DNA-methyltransferase (adenine-specific)
MIKLMMGDCLERMKEIESGSVDLIVADLPYGTVKGIADDSGVSHGMKNKTQWDTVIDTDSIMIEANRILRKNGKMVLFAQQPFTTELIVKAIPNLPFNYTMTWEKDHFANSLIAKKAPVSYAEDILVFSKNHDHLGLHPLRDYFKLIMGFVGLNLKQINVKLGHRRAEHSFYVDSTQFGLCTLKTYNELMAIFNIEQMEGFKSFAELEEINSVFSSVFNLWEGNKFKSNILKYKKDYDGHHPTQKPVLLLEDLIKTYSNEGNLVVDMTMGSGSTGVACVNTGRSFIGIELDESYFNIAQKRIDEA